jgi:hypothetical protein
MLLGIAFGEKLKIFIFLVILLIIALYIERDSKGRKNNR